MSSFHRFSSFLLFALCWFGLSSTAWADVQTVVRSNVKVLPTTSLAANPNALNTGAVQVQRTAPEVMNLRGAVPDVEVGDILIDRQGSGSADKVVSVVTGGGETTVRTRPAGLTEIFEQADIRVDQRLNAANFTATQLPLGVTFEVAQSAPPTSSSNDGPQAATIPVKDFKFYFQNFKVTKDSASITLNGSVSYRSSLNLDIDIRTLPYPKPTRVRSVVKNTASADLEVKAEGKATISKTRRRIGVMPGAPITVFVGPAPIVITPKLEFFVTTEASMQGGLILKPKASFSFEAGLEWTPEAGTRPIFNTSGSIKCPIEPYVEGTAELVPVRAELSFGIYGFQGPYLFVDALKFKATVTPRSTLCYQVTVQNVFGAGFDADIFGVRYSKLNIETSYEQRPVSLIDDCLGSPPSAPPPSRPTSYNATFLEDLTVPDSSSFAVNQSFTKRWRIQNNGRTSWSGCRYAFDGGSKLGGPDSIAAPAIAAGANWEPALNLRAPSEAGNYRSYWRMQAPNGAKFGERFYVDIRVYGASTPSGPGTPTTPRPGYDSAAYVADVNVPDGTAFNGNQTFTKTWRIRNTGSRAWGAGYKWTFDGGVAMGGATVDVPTINPGSTWDASVALKAPAGAGTYKGFWRMQAPNNTKFGTQVWVEIRVNGSVNPNITTYVSETDGAPQEGAPGFWRHGTSSYWKDATGYGDGNHMLWTYNNDPAHGIDNMGDWRPNLPETRLYEVFVYIPRNFGTTRQAQYEIYHADGRTDRIIDQYIYSDKWVSLGTYRFNAGSGNFVRLIDRTNEPYTSKMIGFDAVKWEARNAPAPPQAVTTYVPETATAPAEGAPGFFRRGPAQYWHDAYNVGDGGHVLWTQNNSTAQGIQNMGDWRPNLPSAGYYQVYVFVPSRYSTTKNARYEIYHADGRSDVPVYQLVYKDEWVSLGTFRFSSGSANFVRLIDVTNEGAQTTQIAFDSVKWEKRNDPPPTLSTTVVRETDAASSNGAPGFWRWGTARYWQDVNGIGLDGHMLWVKNNDNAHGIDNMGDWRPNLPQKAKYEVFVYIPHNYATTRDAHYEIYHADGRTDVTLDQLSRNDEWVSLGTYRFNGGTGGLLRLIDRTNEGYITTKIGFDSAKWERRPANAKAPSNLQPREGAKVGKSVNLSWQDGGMDDGNPSANFKIQVWDVADGTRGERVWESDWKVGTSRAWTAPEQGEYEWVVEAGNGVNQSAFSAPARFVVLPPAPEAPTNLVAQSIAPDRIGISWEDNSKNEGGFKIERKTATGAWAELARVETDFTSYVDGGLNPSTSATYRVLAFGAAGDSAFSNEASATTVASYDLAAISVTPEFADHAMTVTGTVSLAGPAQNGGAVIALASSNDKVIVPAQVTIAAGQESVTFDVTAAGVTQADLATITASFGEDTQSATLSLGKANSAPVLSDATLSASVGNAFSQQLAGTDADGDALTYRVSDGALPDGVTLSPEGLLAGTPTTAGTASATIEVADGGGATASATVTIEVASNDRPLDFVPTLAPTAPLTNQVLTVEPNIPLLPGFYFSPSYQWKRNGVAIPNATGQSLDLSLPGQGDKNDVITCEVTATDARSGRTATESAQVTVANSTPIAISSKGEVPADTEKGFVLNYFDADGDAVTFKRVGGPRNGVTADIRVDPADGKTKLFYKSRPFYGGVDIIRFVVFDSSNKQSNESTLGINVLYTPPPPANRAPIAGDTNIDTYVGKSEVKGLLGSDPDGDAITFRIVGNAKYGRSEIKRDTDGFFKLFYTSLNRFYGKDAVTYVVKDSRGKESNLATVNINFINRSPVALGNRIQVAAGETVSQFLFADDPDNDAVTYRLVNNPRFGRGEVGLDPEGKWRFFYTSLPGYVGPDQITFIAIDPFGKESSVAAIDINVVRVSSTAPSALASKVETPSGGGS